MISEESLVYVANYWDRSCSTSLQKYLKCLDDSGAAAGCGVYVKEKVEGTEAQMKTTLMTR